MLLLRGGLQEQHRLSKVEAAEGFQDPADTLQEEARREVVRVQEVREAVCGERGLEDAREELWEALVLHLWLRF